MAFRHRHFEANPRENGLRPKSSFVANRRAGVHLFCHASTPARQSAGVKAETVELVGAMAVAVV